MSKHFDLETFTFNGHTLRYDMIDGDPWFSAKDDLILVGVDYDSVKGARHYLPDDMGADETREGKLLPPESFGGKGGGAREGKLLPPESFRGKGGGARKVLLLSESALYKVILRAQRKNPAAKEFQDWITKHVIPAIRKDGGYVKDEEKVATGEVTAQEVSANLWKFFAKKLEVLEAISAPLRKSANDMQQERLAVIEEQRAIRELIEKNERRIAELEARQGAAAARLKVVAWQKEQILTAKEALKKADNPTDYGVAA